MYASFAATTAGAAGATGGAMRLWQRAGLGNPNAPGARIKRPAAGSATSATPQELRPLRARRPEPGRVILGRTGGAFGRLLAAEDCHSVLVFGPPGSFKTVGVIISAILAGDHTLYLYAPVHEQRRLRPLFETVAMQLVQTAQEQAARAPDGMLDPRLLCALDEAGNVAALELLPEWATTGRGQGIQLLSVWHDQAQLIHR
jgi:type IV secretory pathway TraG/TraD family ATPase VirD4